MTKATDQYEPNSAVYRLIIKKSAPTFTAANCTLKYNGKRKNLLQLGKITTNSPGKLTAVYYTDPECTKKTTVSKHGAVSAGMAPKAKGTYYVKASVPETANFKSGASRTVKLVIR
ncbi:MAG: hypothetical protein IKF90_20065 [Parasporobacterium sp.]|nr:hypothetical protein [Parasporobacterium sp.]